MSTALDGWYLVERNRHVYQQATEELGREALDILQKNGVTDIVLTRLVPPSFGRPLDMRAYARIFPCV